MGLKLIHISKRGNWWSNPLDITLVVLTINCLCKTFPDFAIKVLCYLTTINLTFKFQLMVHEELSWRNCKCPVDLWQPGQIVLKKFHPSKNPVIPATQINIMAADGLTPSVTREYIVYWCRGVFYCSVYSVLLAFSGGLPNWRRLQNCTWELPTPSKWPRNGRVSSFW